MKKEKKTPRGVRFCWNCSKKLRGNHYALHINEDGREVVVHKECKKILEPKRYEFEASAIEEDADREMGIERHWKY